MNYTLYLTENCNLRCKYCYEKNKTTNEMDYNTIKSIIDYEIKQNDIHSQINFYGGEPLLKKNLIYILMNMAIGKVVNFTKALCSLKLVRK